MHLSVLGIVIVCVSGLIVGAAKTGIQGLGIVLVPLVAMAMPGKASTGFVLPLLLAGDVIAILVWRRKVVWLSLLKVLPWTVLGIVAGYFAMAAVSETLFKPLLGGLILGLIVLDLVRRLAGIGIKADHGLVVALVGILAGVSTMMANAGGAVMTIYLLSMALPKEEYVGTTAMFFFILNLVKFPFSLALGLITGASLWLNLLLLPLVILGAWLGLVVVKKLPQKVFNVVAQVLAGLGGLKLLL